MSCSNPCSTSSRDLTFSLIVLATRGTRFNILEEGVVLAVLVVLIRRSTTTTTSSSLLLLRMIMLAASLLGSSSTLSITLV